MPRLSVDRFFKRALLLMVCLLPLQALPRTIWAAYHPGSELPAVIKLASFLDEIMLLASLAVLFTFICLRNNFYRVSFIGLGKWVALFLAVCLASMAINGVRPLQGAFGAYDFMKNIMLLFVFYMLRFDDKDIKDFISALKVVGVVFAVFAIIGELSALFFEAGIGILVAENMRYGLYRAISLSGQGNHNYVGVFGVLVFSLFLVKTVKRPGDYVALLLISVMILLTFSRQAWLGFAVILLILGSLNTKLSLVLLSIPAVLISASFYDGLSAILVTDLSFDPEEYFRLYAFLYSLKVLGEHVFFGLGPGTYGGLASIMFESGVYDEWPIFFKEFAYRINGIDQFWPVVWAETGIFGMFAYSMVFAGLFSALRGAYAFFLKQGDIYMYRLGRALAGFIAVIVIMCFAGGLNSAFVVFSFFGIAGIYLSRFRDESEKQPC